MLQCESKKKSNEVWFDFTLCKENKMCRILGSPDEVKLAKMYYLNFEAKRYAKSSCCLYTDTGIRIWKFKVSS